MGDVAVDDEADRWLRRGRMDGWGRDCYNIISIIIKWKCNYKWRNGRCAANKGVQNEEEEQ